MRSILTHTSAILALFFWLGAGLAAADGPVLATEPLAIVTASGERHAFVVELAISATERERGLMERTTLAETAGMLFDFGQSRVVRMWMRNTPLSLDMLFIAEDGTIARIRADTEPMSEAIIDSGDPVRFVLEVRAGTAARLGISAGDRVESATISRAKAP